MEKKDTGNFFFLNGNNDKVDNTGYRFPMNNQSLDQNKKKFFFSPPTEKNSMIFDYRISINT